MALNAQVAKAQVKKQSELVNTPPARKFLAKRQKKRGGIGNDRYRLQSRSYNGSAAPGEMEKADGRIRTIHDLVDFHYGFVPQYFAEKNDVQKADDTVAVGDNPGINNVVYGQEVYTLLNHEANLFSLIEKRPWRKSGERIIVERGRSLGEGGHQQNAPLPDTDHPEIDEYEQDVTTVAHTFDVTQEQQLLSDTNDDRLDDPFDFYRRYYGTGTEYQSGEGEHPKHINAQLGSPANRDESSGAVFEDAFLPLDRVISDQDEATSILSDPQDASIYGFDRSAGEFEASVLSASGGGDRNVTLDLFDDAVTAVRESSGKEPVTDDNYFWLTGHDTFQLLEEEVGSKERLEPVRTSVGLNGVETNAGDDIGITVQSYKDIPIFRTNDLVTDSVSRVFLIDSSTIFMKQLLPTQFYSTGINIDDNPFALDRRANEGMFLTMGELTCTNPAAQAKIRDLK